MTAKIIIDGKNLFLNPFMTGLIGNVLDAIAKSLKSPDGNRVEFILTPENLRLLVDENEVPLNLGQAQNIVSKILRGILQSLHGAENGTEYHLICERR